MKGFVFRKFGRMPSKKEEPLPDLWRLLRWSHAYDMQHLSPARDTLTTLGRTWVECRTLEDVFAATSNLARQRTGARDACPGR